MRGTSELLLCFDLIFLLISTLNVESLNITEKNFNFQEDKSLLETRKHNLPSVISQKSELTRSINRLRRSDDFDSSEEDTSEKEENEWTNINEEVDIVIPKVLHHLQNMGVEYLQLPDIKESISVVMNTLFSKLANHLFPWFKKFTKRNLLIICNQEKPLFLTYEAGLFLSNGIVYNIAGINRYGSANMTYQGKSFRTVFYLIINKLQFEYNFLLRLMLLEGYGKVIGSLDDTIIYADLDVTMPKLALELNDFRVVSFRNINVQLDQIRIVRELTGVILSPITNLFKERITTSISDKLRDQMQLLMDDFNTKDPLQLKTFAKTLLAGLTGKAKE